MFPIAKIIAVIAAVIHIGAASFYSQPVAHQDSRASFKHKDGIKPDLFWFMQM
jgi:hypothetical protein